MYYMYIYHLILKLVGKRDYNLSILSNFMISYLFFNKDFWPAKSSFSLLEVFISDPPMAIKLPQHIDIF